MFVRLPLHAIMFIADNFISAQTPTHKAHHALRHAKYILYYNFELEQPNQPNIFVLVAIRSGFS